MHRFPLRIAPDTTHSTPQDPPYVLLKKGESLHHYVYIHGYLLDHPVQVCLYAIGVQDASHAQIFLTITHTKHIWNTRHDTPQRARDLCNTPHTRLEHQDHIIHHYPLPDTVIHPDDIQHHPLSEAHIHRISDHLHTYSDPIYIQRMRVFTAIIQHLKTQPHHQQHTIEDILNLWTDHHAMQAWLPSHALYPIRNISAIICDIYSQTNTWIHLDTLPTIKELDNPYNNGPIQDINHPYLEQCTIEDLMSLAKYLDIPALPHDLDQYTASNIDPHTFLHYLPDTIHHRHHAIAKISAPPADTQHPLHITYAGDPIDYTQHTDESQYMVNIPIYIDGQTGTLSYDMQQHKETQGFRCKFAGIYLNKYIEAPAWSSHHHQPITGYTRIQNHQYLQLCTQDIYAIIDAHPSPDHVHDLIAILSLHLKSTYVDGHACPPYDTNIIKAVYTMFHHLITQPRPKGTYSIHTTPSGTHLIHTPRNTPDDHTYIWKNMDTLYPHLPGQYLQKEGRGWGRIPINHMLHAWIQHPQTITQHAYIQACRYLQGQDITSMPS